MTAWYRAYSETLNDPKVQTLPLDAFKAWHNCLYYASTLSSKSGNIGTLDAIAFVFRETKESVSSAFHPLIERGLLVTVDETFQIVSWAKRQYKSDTSTERVKQFRKRSRNVTETAPESDTETDIRLSKDNRAIDPEKAFWDAAKKFAPAAMVGKWLKQHGKEMTMAAINAGQLEKAVDPVAYCQGYFRRQLGNGKTEPEYLTPC